MRDQRRCRQNLQRAFPTLAAVRVEATARRCFRHFGRMALWTIAMADRDPRRLLRGMAVEGAENYRTLHRACRAGHGTVGITGHFGNWEVLARISGLLVPTSMIGKRLRHPVLNEVVHQARMGGGGRIIYQDEDIRVPLRALRDGRLVTTLADQDLPRLAGVHVPWFGIPAYTPVGPAALTLLGGGAVQPIFCFACAGRWVLHVGPRRTFPRSGDRDADLRAIMTWTTAYQERLVRRHPEQWVWWHMRWRTRPEDRSALPPSPPAQAAASASR